jgi:hypothetical protein
LFWERSRKYFLCARNFQKNSLLENPCTHFKFP